MMAESEGGAVEGASREKDDVELHCARQPTGSGGGAAASGHAGERVVVVDVVRRR